VNKKNQGQYFYAAQSEDHLSACLEKIGQNLKEE